MRVLSLSATLIDGRTGLRTSLSEPGCLNTAAVGGSSVVFTCGQGQTSLYELYSIATGKSRMLTVNPAIFAPGPVAAVGADWIAFAGSCFDQEHCGVPSPSFQNLTTGVIAADPSGPSTTVDLDSPTLRHTLCAPVVNPGRASIDGRFVIATSPGGSYLEHCGSHLHEFLTYTSYPGCAQAACGPPSDSHSIVWESKPRRLSGIFLPSRQRFTIPVPAKVDPTPGMYVNGDQYALALTWHTVYVENSGRVWTATIPSTPPGIKRSRH